MSVQVALTSSTTAFTETEELVVGVEGGRGVALGRRLVEAREDVTAEDVSQVPALAATAEDLGPHAYREHDDEHDDADASTGAHREREATSTAGASATEAGKAHTAPRRTHAAAVFHVGAASA